MGKFSLRKGDGDDDSNRRALFGSRNKAKSPAPPADNPYAQPAIPPDPYTRAKMNAGIIAGGPGPGPGATKGQGPPSAQGTYGGMSAGSRQNPYAQASAYPPAPSGSGYGQPPSSAPGGRPDGGEGVPQGQGQGQGRYGAEKFGNQNGYGAAQAGGNPYSGRPQLSSTVRGGSYGGLGGGLGGPPGYDSAPDPNRDELFGGAQQRLEQRQHEHQAPNGPPGYEYNPSEGEGGVDRSYGAYGDRQLTAEEEEEEDIQAAKQEIRFMKQQDVSSTRNALRIAAETEEIGRNTLARLGAQGERMHNTDRHLDIGNNHINIAEDKAKELKTLNRSMFAVHVNNPFTAKERRAQRDEKILERHHNEREQREATREAAFRSTQRMNQNFKGVEETYNTAAKKTNLAERSKYQFEADSEDDAMEDEIDRNLGELHGAAKRLNLLAKATGEEIDQQNKLIQSIAEKSDRFDDRLHMQTEKLKRIR